ncbi:MAG: hypothetical protein H6988_11565 [Pseudomonadales bacterium]|nr:hypothetical protein [Pseudomonadales bacterium]
MIRVTIDDRAARRALAQGQRQVRYAAAVALTKAAKILEGKLQQTLKANLDRPTAWVARGTFVKPATKLSLSAEVGMRDRPGLYVKEHFAPGLRGMKPYELVLEKLGALPSGHRAVPGAGLRLDSRGNPNRAQLSEMIGALRTGMQTYKGRGKRVALVGYFVAKPGNPSRLHPGVYRRQGLAIRPMLLFVAAAGYRQRIDFPELAMNVVNKQFNNLFATVYEQALRTAR